MSTYGPFHRRGNPGGPGCRVLLLPVQAQAPDGTPIDGSLLDGGPETSELELLRTVAYGLGIQWGHDEFGWWAGVPHTPISQFAEEVIRQQQQRRPPQFALFREDDNGARFLIAHFESEEAARQRAAELAHGGHKQHYFIEPAAEAGGP